MMQHGATLAGPRTQAAQHFIHSVLVILSYFVIAVAAAFPRLLDLGVFLTVDEWSFWMRRSTAFVNALQSGEYGATAIAPHPGVTTMWLGGLGQSLYDTLLHWHVITDTSFQVYLAWQQFPVAAVHTLGVVAGYMLLRHLFAPLLAFLGALLWATDPFVIGFSRVLHVDMLAGTFLTLSLLAACVYWHHDRRWPWLARSAVLGALAILSKLPAMIIIPMIIGLALVALRWPVSGADTDTPPLAWRMVIRAAARPLLVWGAIVCAVVLLAWPAVWANPSGVYDLLRFGVVSEGGEPHATGDFFLGQPVAAPDLSFYPVTLALRTTPWTLLGLLLLPFAYWRWPRMTRRTLAVLAIFVILFMVGISASPKKFNRYLVPAFPVVDMLAAAGLLGIGTDARWLWQHPRARQAVPAGVLAVVTVASVANTMAWHPYSIAAYNQALGGAMAGANTFQTGWGEGLEQAADWLNEQPDITSVLVASTLADPLQRYLRHGAQVYTPNQRLQPKTGYVVVYIRSTQEPSLPAPFDEWYGKVAPLHVVSVHGVPYAWIYQVPPVVGHVSPATFGAAFELRGFDGSVRVQSGSQVQLKLLWRAARPVSQNYMLFVHLLGSDGRQYAHADLPYTRHDWAPQRFITRELRLPLPADLTPGTYQLAIGLYDPATGKRLPLTAQALTDRADDGDDAFLLTSICVK
ncbi:MAG TPA: glycosyltransferase family 39 protein [Roseiflexaceae bacterium]|jgi:4-amino-4-deoxy-L-arabinose transferase-like glycosyltransferase|nr:glycosyltransferase family 39 protein [Roseiflexaceae bacterium]